MVLNSPEDVVEEQLNQWAANDSSTYLVQRGCNMSCVRDYKCPKMKKLGFSKGLTAWNCSTPRAQQSEDQKEKPEAELVVPVPWARDFPFCPKEEFCGLCKCKEKCPHWLHPSRNSSVGAEEGNLRACIQPKFEFSWMNTGTPRRINWSSAIPSRFPR